MAYSIVQSTTITAAGNQTIALSGVVAGNAIVVFSGVGGPTTVSGVADAQGSYTQLAAGPGTTTMGAYAHGLANATSGTHTATISTSSGGTWGAATMVEIGGVSVTPFDGAAALAVANGSYTAATDGLSFGNFSTTLDGDFILAFMAPGGTNDQATAGTGYTIVVNSTAPATSTHVYVATKTQTTHGSITPTYSPTGVGDSWGTVAVALSKTQPAVLTATKGTYSITGQTTSLIYRTANSKVLSAAMGTYGITGQTTNLVYHSGAPTNYSLVAATGVYNWVGARAYADYAASANRGTYSIAGQAATLTYTSTHFHGVLTAAKGVYSVTGIPANLIYAGQGLADNGKYRKVKVFIVSSAGRTRWVSYIPIKQFPATTSAQADRFDDNGALTVKILASNAGLVEWVDYVPVVVVSDSNVGKWRYDDLGFVPVVPVF